FRKTVVRNMTTGSATEVGAWDLDEFLTARPDDDLALVVAALSIPVVYTHRDLAADLALKTCQNDVEPRREIILKFFALALVAAGRLHLVFATLFIEARKLGEHLVAFGHFMKPRRVDANRSRVTNDSFNRCDSAVAFNDLIMRLRIAF